MVCHHYCNNSIRCPECIKLFWKWAENHTRGKAKRKRHEGVPSTAMSFYEHAGKSYDESHGRRSHLVMAAGCEPVSGEFDPRRLPK